MEAELGPVGKIPKVTITPKGIFKYILIRGDLDWRGQKEELCFVRGDEKF